MKRMFPLLALALASAAPATALAADQQSPRIMVTGQGESTLAPDLAVLSLSVMREAKTARAALTANNDAMAAVISAMKAAGIAERDLQTTGVQIVPRYENTPTNGGGDETKIVAYQVINSLQIRVRDIAKTGEILDRSVSLGVNQGGGISFTNDDPAAARTDARKKAVADAFDKARTLSEAAGVKLGRVLEIAELGNSQPPMPMMTRYMAKAADSVPFEAGEAAYHVEVNVTFALD